MSCLLLPSTVLIEKSVALMSTSNENRERKNAVKWRLLRHFEAGNLSDVACPESVERIDMHRSSSKWAVVLPHRIIEILAEAMSILPGSICHGRP